MEPQLKYENPPNFEAICAAFPHVREHKGAIFCYGDVIYTPNLEPGQGIAPHLVVHESVHMRQQKEAGGPEAWWERYLADVEFRLVQEVEAYRAQYHFVLTNHGNDKRALERFLFDLAGDLSGPMYGNIISFGAAESKIRRPV